VNSHNYTVHTVLYQGRNVSPEMMETGLRKLAQTYKADTIQLIDLDASNAILAARERRKQLLERREQRRKIIELLDKEPLDFNRVYTDEEKAAREQASKELHDAILEVRRRHMAEDIKAAKAAAERAAIKTKALTSRATYRPDVNHSDSGREARATRTSAAGSGTKGKGNGKGGGDSGDGDGPECDIVSALKIKMPAATNSGRKVAGILKCTRNIIRVLIVCQGDICQKFVRGGSSSSGIVRYGASTDERRG
jgi:hypothetical protein